MKPNYIKYPRTFHLPYSLTVSDDDKRLSSDDIFSGIDVVVTEKRDGENSTIYPNGYMHARSIDGNKHEWQAWLKKYAMSWAHDIPEGFRVCGENLYPRHSIAYRFPDEKMFFQVFGIYNEKNVCLSWDHTKDWCELLDLVHVPVIYEGTYDKDAILSAFAEYEKKQPNEVEGFVVRNRGAFRYEDFCRNVAKYVRANHVQTDEHWTKHWEPNKIIAK